MRSSASFPVACLDTDKVSPQKIKVSGFKLQRVVVGLHLNGRVAGALVATSQPPGTRCSTATQPPDLAARALRALAADGAQIIGVASGRRSATRRDLTAARPKWSARREISIRSVMVCALTKVQQFREYVSEH
eukprot:6214225-Pleurochrysis_carterae.AAC.2